MLPGIASAVVFWTAGPAVIRILFGARYEAAAPVFTLMSLAVAVGGLAAFGASVLAGARRFREQLVSIVLAVAVQVPLCALLIPGNGPTTAAWVEVARYGVCTVYLTIAGNAIFRRCRDTGSTGVP
jgi:O-antigen/teichoic acid export membrane protein